MTDERKIEKEDLQDVLGETLIEEYGITLGYHHMCIIVDADCSVLVSYGDIQHIRDLGDYVEMRLRRHQKTFEVQIYRTVTQICVYEVE